MWELGVLLVVLIVLVLAVSRWRWHPFIALLLAALALGLCSGMGGVETVRLLGEGFGNTLKWIAIVVILGAFIGEVLRETGGALRIANAVVKLFGEKRLPWAMGFTGYLVSIPVFVDVAYIVLQPVTEAIAVRAKKPVLVIGLALTAGLTVSHTLLPPTPGPLAVASILGADIGRLLLINAFVGLWALAGGVLWVKYFCKNSWIAYDEEIARTNLTLPTVSNTKKSANQAPLLDLLPILIPIVLMGGGAFLQSDEGTFFQAIVGFLSTPMVAVLIGAGVAAIQFRRKKADGNLSNLVEQAITKSALVIMITGAGGAFGYLIRESGVQGDLTDFFAKLPFLSFFLPFFIAAVLTTATGSITVSLIGAASMVGPLVDVLPYSPELLAAITGCGAFRVFHANSSFFWLLNRLHRVPVATLYRTYTLQSLVMGLTGLAGVGLLYLLGVA
jgi:GntP family gluconate:H+ symporter